MARMQMTGAARHILDAGLFEQISDDDDASDMWKTGGYSPPPTPQTAHERAKIAALLEQAGRKDLAIHYMACRSWNPDNPYRCGLRWICLSCGWVAQQRAKDEMNARGRILLSKQPDALYVMSTTNAPRSQSLAREVEMLRKVRTWIRRSRARNADSPWSTCIGTYCFTDFAARMRWPHDVFAHDHAIDVFCAEGVIEWAAREAERRETRGLRGHRQLVWPLFLHGLRRDTAAAFHKLFNAEFQQDQAKKKNPARFFHAQMIKANEDIGCETFVAGERADVLKDLREIADYSWATESKDEKRHLTAAQRVQIQCLTGVRMRGGSGVFRGIPGIVAAAKSIQRGRIIGQRMAAQLRADVEWEALMGHPGSQKGVLECASE